MFGKKKQEELAGKINKLREMISCCEKNLHEKYQKVNEAFRDVCAGVDDIKRNYEDNKRDVSYLNIIAEELKEKIEKIVEEFKDLKIDETLKEIIDEIKNYKPESPEDNESKSEDVTKEIQGIRQLLDELKEINGQTSALSLNAAILAAGMSDGDIFVQTATDIKNLASDGGKIIMDINRKLDALEEVNREQDKYVKETVQKACSNLDVITELKNKFVKVVEGIEGKEEKIKVVEEKYNKVMECIQELIKSATDLDEGTDEMFAGLNRLSGNICMQEDVFEELSSEINLLAVKEEE